MMLELGDDGVVSSVNEEDLIYVDKNELDQFVESYHKLEKENEQLKDALNQRTDQCDKYYDENEQLRKEKECDKQVFTKKRLHELLQQTQKENEHIKQTIKTMMENERTELGQSVLRQLQEAIK